MVVPKYAPTCPVCTNQVRLSEAQREAIKQRDEIIQKRRAASEIGEMAKLNEELMELNRRLAI